MIRPYMEEALGAAGSVLRGKAETCSSKTNMQSNLSLAFAPSPRVARIVAIG